MEGSQPLGQSSGIPVALEAYYCQCILAQNLRPSRTPRTAIVPDRFHTVPCVSTHIQRAISLAWMHNRRIEWAEHLLMDSGSSFLSRYTMLWGCELGQALGVAQNWSTRTKTEDVTVKLIWACSSSLFCTVQIHWSKYTLHIQMYMDTDDQHQLHNVQTEIHSLQIQNGTSKRELLRKMKNRHTNRQLQKFCPQKACKAAIARQISPLYFRHPSEVATMAWSPCRSEHVELISWLLCFRQFQSNQGQDLAIASWKEGGGRQPENEG